MDKKQNRKKLFYLADIMLSTAKKLGAEQADVHVASGDSQSVSIRNQKLEQIDKSDGSGILLRTIIGKKQASVSTSNIDESSIPELVKRCVDMTNVAPADPYCGLPEKSLLCNKIPDLNLHDSKKITIKELELAAMEAEHSALSTKGITNSEASIASHGESVGLLANSHGFAKDYCGTMASISCQIISGTNSDMQQDYEYTSARFWKNLDNPKLVGKLAAEKCLKKMYPKKINSTRCPVIFDPCVGNSLIGHLASAISGSSVVRKSSFLKDKMNEKIFPDDITIIDDPLKLEGLASSPFDAEGVKSQKMNIVENGVLKHWLLDNASAKQLNMVTTGNAAKSGNGLIYPSSSNLHVQNGKIKKSDLFVDIQKGFYVTELIGFGVNTVTGDYSRGASGFLIENGELTTAVNEVTIASNLINMYKDIKIANDLSFKYSKNVPTLLISEMTISGK
tara:strand:- start:203 stop:1555 length:1353 start_codon:yes stop_codon:yes gene_type:complete